MRIKVLYIFLTLLTISLLSGGIGFIYIDGQKNIKEERVGNDEQIENSLIFIGFISKYKLFMQKEFETKKDIESHLQEYKFAEEAIESIGFIDTRELEASRNLIIRLYQIHKKRLRLNTLKKLSLENIEKKWGAVEALLSEEITTRMKNGQEFMPGFKKTLSRWAKNLSFFEKIKESIDVSYVNQEKFLELQELISVSRWLILEKPKANMGSFLSDFELEIKEKTIPHSLKQDLRRRLNSYLLLMEKHKTQDEKSNRIERQVEQLRFKGKENLNNNVVPRWQNYVRQDFNLNISARNKRHKLVVQIVTVIGIFIILAMLLIFLNIFPYLGKLELKARQVGAGDFSSKFKGRIPKNEIGNVMNAFNNMSDEINLFVKKLKSNEREKIQLSDSVQKMRRIAELGEFSAKMAHELKNPIAILNFCLADAIESLQKNDLKRCKEELEKSEQTLERLKLTSSKLGAKNIYSDSEIGIINLNDFVLEVQGIYLPLLSKEEISLEVKDLAHEIFVQGSKLDLLGAISNLIDNAAEYINSSAEPLKSIDLKLETKDGVGIISVSNFGEEIVASEQLFNNFYSTKVGHTRGLGLTIVKDVAESFKGEIAYLYFEGKNSFILKLPLT